MISVKKLLTKILIKVDVPKQLDSITTKPSSVGTSWTHKTVDAVADYNLIGVRFKICTTSAIQVDQMLLFPRSIGNWTQNVTWSNNSTYVRGRVYVNWDTNQIGVALINGDITNAYCEIQQVFGLLHK